MIDAICANCEYFDGGGLGADNKSRKVHGDCLNSYSPRFETSAHMTCGQFFPCTVRWPIRMQHNNIRVMP
jgi:hypothetical protein